MKNNAERKILIVDDEPANIFLLEGLLIAQDYQVLTAMNGTDALTIINTEGTKLDLILLDIMMPDITGLDVLQQIMSDKELKHIPVIMVTAKTDSTDVEDALAKGAIEYVKKPIDEIELLARLNTALRISEQENRLRQMLKSKDEFLQIVSHDLRTPFASISGFADILLMDVELMNLMNSDHKEFLQHILNTSHYIVEYFNKLLNWSQMGAKELKISKEEVLLIKLLNTTKVVFQSKIQTKQQTLNIECNENILIKADSTYISQVIHNLLSNAIKFTPNQGQITIKATEEAEGVKIQVIDSGIGIPEEKRDDFFSENFHTTTKGTNGEKGTGVGLSICKKIIDSHGFSISFDSKENEGTTFNILTY